MQSVNNEQSFVVCKNKLQFLRIFLFIKVIVKIHWMFKLHLAANSRNYTLIKYYSGGDIQTTFEENKLNSPIHSLI